MGRTLRRFQVAARLGFYTVPYHSKVLPTPQRKKGAFNSPVGACIPPACSRHGVPIHRGFIGEGSPNPDTHHCSLKTPEVEKDLRIPIHRSDENS